jgi:hypothetical protein
MDIASRRLRFITHRAADFYRDIVKSFDYYKIKYKYK